MLPGITGLHRTNSSRRMVDILDDLAFRTNLKLCLDAADIESAPTSATKWLDLSGNGYDFFRGTTAGADATDPTFNGTPGNLSLNEYWSFDAADFFRYDTTNETWMQNLHKDNAKFTVAMWINFPAGAVVKSLFGTLGATAADTGIRLQLQTIDNIILQVYNAGTIARQKTCAAAPGDSGWQFVALSLDEAAGGLASILQVGQSQETFDGTYTSPAAVAASFTMEIGASGNAVSPVPAGSLIGMVSMWEGRALTSAELTVLFQATRSRYSPQPAQLLAVLTTLGLLTNLKLCLDGDDSASYSGGTKWLDVSGQGTDFFLGSDATTTADPVFRGTNWSFGGANYFRYDSANETWMNNLHKDNAKFTIALWVKVGAVSVTKDFVGTRGAIANTGIKFGTNAGAGSQVRLEVANAGANVLNFSATPALTVGAWFFCAISLDETIGASGCVVQTNGTQELFTSTYVSPSAAAASFAMEIGAGGNAFQPLSNESRIGMVGMWDRALSAAELDTIFQATRGRYGV